MGVLSAALRAFVTNTDNYRAQTGKGTVDQALDNIELMKKGRDRPGELNSRELARLNKLAGE